MSAHEKATPRPWRVTKRQPTIISNDGGDKWLARALIGPTKSPRFLHDSEQAEANAALIVEAVNSFEALTAERDALKAENDKLRQANRDLMEVVKPFAARGEHSNPTQVVALGACKKARAVYDRLHEVECIILWATP